jgi:hypothetical protein
METYGQNTKFTKIMRNWNPDRVKPNTRSSHALTLLPVAVKLW